MKITIDTKEDSHDDIKKVLKMLEAWVEGQGASPMNMFGDIGNGSEGSPSTESSGDLFSLFDDKDKKEETSEIMELDSDDKKDDIPPVTTY